MYTNKGWNSSRVSSKINNNSIRIGDEEVYKITEPVGASIKSINVVSKGGVSSLVQKSLILHVQNHLQ